ncbi:M48 family metallopeptidase [Desulfopila sp. IMCC35006]|uniref:M48 family metallopeptidase n=1 Tax=Desulfopila sp. IMCC35006 TaxID=2569542 RepID=UPI0010ABBE81|nr:M48 family metallopeptidase [Desulfopila sp. IMCC35006]TKB23616.1 M48 family metallopeptidase [Desulfopila sp. IMCC35006]
MNFWLFIVLLIIAISYLLELIVSLLNITALDPALPKEFAATYNEQEYQKSQEYTRATTSFSLVENSYSTIITVLFLLFGGFNYIDIWVRSFNYGQIVTGLLFIGTLGFLTFVTHLPFSIYSTFVLEERFGFNRTSLQTFILDICKGGLLSIVLGAPILALVLWFFMYAGVYGWLYCWLGVVLFSLVLQFLAPVLIMPLFNKFSPLEDGPLQDRILDYAKQEHFKLQGIFTMDGSKRSSKLNAFFTGFGRFRKIVFYDTLLDKLNDSEIIAVLAHEMGHFKLKHVIKMILASIVQTGIMFYLLGIFLSNSEISSAFRMQHTSVYSSLLFFGFLYSPINLLVSIIFHFFSRKNEFAADRYAAQSTGVPEFLVSSLKKLSQANLSNLTPHPTMVFLHYSHPPVLQRIEKLREYGSTTGFDT